MLRSHRRRSSNELQVEAALKIQRWWREAYTKHTTDKAPLRYHQHQETASKRSRSHVTQAESAKAALRTCSKFETHQSNAFKKPAWKSSSKLGLQSKLPYEQAVKYSTKPKAIPNENEFTANQPRVNAISVIGNESYTKKPSEKASSILKYLEETDAGLPSSASSVIAQSTHSEAIQLKTELEEAHKNIATLKAAVERQKAIIQEATDKIQLECDAKLASQKAEFEQLNERNAESLQNLMKEKEHLLHLNADSSRQAKDLKRRHALEIEELAAKFDRELKTQKDHWQLNEMARREIWLREKAKEIRDSTARGLEPEIAGMIREQRQVVEKLKEQHKADLKRQREAFALEKDSAVREARKAWIVEAETSALETLRTRD